MTVSSRTPEGMPSKCPLCGAKTNIGYSDPGQDAPCPRCGHLLWASMQLVSSVTQYYSETMGTTVGVIDVNTQFSDLGADSLDTVEMVMELEEEFDINIPESEALNLRTIGDVVRYIIENRRDTNS